MSVSKFPTKKLLLFLALSGLLALFCYTIWTDTIFLLGVAAILLHIFKNFRFFGWAAILLYPLTYWRARLLDTPTPHGSLPNNFYLYWYSGYVLLTIVCFITELLIRHRYHSFKHPSPVDSR